MATLKEQLKEHGFSDSFTPEAIGKFQTIKEDNLGKIGYIYEEVAHPKGTIKHLTFKKWSGTEDYISLHEYPDNLSTKDKKSGEELLSSVKKKNIERIEAGHMVAKQLAQQVWDSACVPKFCPSYLTTRGLHFMDGYKVDPENVENLFLPVYDTNMEIHSIATIYQGGMKEFLPGSKISGHFGVLHGDEKMAYICEGFSTAVSIYLATKATVFYTYSCVYYAETIPNLLKAFPQYTFAIAADNDLHTDDNPGYTKAVAIAKRFRLVIKTPKFTHYNGKATSDFDDLRREEGLDVVKTQLQITEKEQNYMDEEYVIPLGFDDENYYFISSQNKTVQCYTALNKDTLFKLMNFEYWEASYGEISKEGNIILSWDKVASALYDQCRKVGIYNPSNVRSVGIYKDGDHSVVHLGNSLLIDGKHTENLRTLKGRYTYALSDFVDYNPTLSITDDQCKEFERHMGLTNIAGNNAVKYVLGWMVCSVVSGMLKWRPHIYITGQKGVGKTQITEIVNRILERGFQAIYTHGVQTTPAGVRQSVKSRSVPLIFDEVESDNKRAKGAAEGFLALCRAACSESEAVTLLGSSSQKSMEFKVAFCAWMAGITPQVKLEQDKQRFAMVEVKMNPELSNEQRAKQWKQVSDYWMTIDKEWCQGLFNRIIMNLDTIKHNIDETTNALRPLLGGRLSDQYGALFGASFLFSHTNKVTDAELEEIKSRVTAGDDSINASSDTEGELELLGTILEGQVTDEDNKRSSVISELRRSNNYAEKTLQYLWSYGVFPIELNGEKFIHIRKTNDIQKRLEYMPNYSTNFVAVLSRIDGCKKNYRLNYNGLRSRGVLVPWNKAFSEKMEGDPGVQF